MFKAFGTSIIAFCTVVCCLAATELGAQQSGSFGPRGQGLFRPKARAISGRYVPRHMRPAATDMISDASVIGTGVVNQEPLAGIQGEVLPPPTGHCADCAAGGIGHVIGEPVGQVFADDCGDCGACGDCFGDCGGCREFDCRDCGIAEDCWLYGLGGIFRNTDYFAGVQGFDSAGYRNAATGFDESSSFGYHLGFNTGLPFYRLTCGLVSGQVGFRWTRSSVESTLFSRERRDQTFFTFGLFRRVDYGFQMGVVADVLRETWFINTETVQVRSELSWVWPSGHTCGFRASIGVQDEITNGIIGNNTRIRGVGSRVINNYRFFFRRALACGGHREFLLGWTDDRQTLVGADYDVPLGACTALEAGFVYLIPERSGRPIDREAWNISLGITYRPRGRGWYDFYHRPLLPVADNGSMILSRIQ